VATAENAASLNNKKTGADFSAPISIKWSGRLDSNQRPQWYPWVRFGASAGKGRSWTTPPLDLGNYVFAIRAKRVGDAMNPVLQEPVNVRRIRVVPPSTAGPTVVVQHPHFAYVIGAGCSFPLTIADMAAHLPISFSIGACADHYGGTVVGYRYGWDILDLERSFVALRRT